MEILENAVQRAKDIFDIACQKTGEAVNTGKQKLDIATLKNKMSKDYEALGKIYFEQIKDNDGVEGNVADIKASILEKQAQIDKITAEMNR